MIAAGPHLCQKVPGQDNVQHLEERLETMVERLNRKDIYGGRVIKVSVDTIRLPNDKVIDLELVEHPGAAAVVPVHEDGTVTMVRQYRYSAGGWIFEVPAGKLDGDEPPEVCAARELREEVGLVARELVPLGYIYPTPGFCDERIWLYLATHLTETAHAQEEDEVMEVVRLPLAEAVAKARGGELVDAKSICGLLRAAARYGF